MELLITLAEQTKYLWQGAGVLLCFVGMLAMYDTIIGPHVLIMSIVKLTAALASRIKHGPVPRDAAPPDAS